jgi:hypothetical protein
MNYQPLSLLAFSVFFVSLSVGGQNLVPNPSFEEYEDCPFSTGALENSSESWESWSFSPDLFHECSNDLDGFAGVPDNAWGWQEPITGDAYAGVFTYTYNGLNIREYMAAPLNEALEVGQEYYLMFYTSMYDGGEKAINWCATNHIGLRFFLNPEYDHQINAFSPDNFAHLDYSEVLTDTLTWTKVEGYFTADEAYNWVAIGNFFTDENTELLPLNSNSTCSGIYYIENICVGLSPSDCDYLVGLEAAINERTIEIFPNPAAEYILIQLDQKSTFTYSVYSICGSQVLPPETVIESSHQIDVSHLPRGVYILSVRINNQTINHKISVL